MTTKFKILGHCSQGTTGPHYLVPWLLRSSDLFADTNSTDTYTYTYTENTDGESSKDDYDKPRKKRSTMVDFSRYSNDFDAFVQLNK